MKWKPELEISPQDIEAVGRVFIQAAPMITQLAQSIMSNPKTSEMATKFTVAVIAQQGENLHKMMKDPEIRSAMINCWAELATKTASANMFDNPFMRMWKLAFGLGE